jgi:hypothetical protein
MLMTVLTNHFDPALGHSAHVAQTVISTLAGSFSVMKPVTERFFILTPTPTNDPKVFLDAEGNEMKWSGVTPPPAIGAQINVTMNNIGLAIVKGYFESCGWLGVMMLPLNPPDWLVRQRKADPGKLKWQQEGIGCVFGAEFQAGGAL